MRTEGRRGWDWRVNAELGGKIRGRRKKDYIRKGKRMWREKADRKQTI